MLLSPAFQIYATQIFVDRQSLRMLPKILQVLEEKEGIPGLKLT